jgi:hypothetical protein
MANDTNRKFCSKKNNLGDERFWRKPDIIVDSILSILNEDSTFTGNQLIDEIYLRKKALPIFSKYQCLEGYEPPRFVDIDLK